MRDSHQLPNATKQVDGFNISVEIHHDGLGREFYEHLRYHDVEAELQLVKWRDLEFMAPGHEQMLHQVARHLEGLHPGDTLKLINVLDVVGYAEQFQQQIDWPRLASRYPHVINTLKCLHLIVPLSDELQSRIGGAVNVPLEGVGQTMVAMRRVMLGGHSWRKKLQLLFLPPEWWMHLYYNVWPEKSLRWVKLVRHPLTLLGWIARRAYAGLFG